MVFRYGAGLALRAAAVSRAFLSQNLFGPGTFNRIQDAVSVGVEALKQGDLAFTLVDLIFALDMGIPGLSGLLFFAPEGFRGCGALFRTEHTVPVGVKAAEQQGFARLHGQGPGVQRDDQEQDGEKE